MKIKVSKSTNTQLNWMVAKAVGMCVLDDNGNVLWVNFATFTPVKSWTQAGPIIEEHPVIAPTYEKRFGIWLAAGQSPAVYGNQTFLVAAMRAFVLSKLGDTVDVPDELICA